MRSIIGCACLLAPVLSTAAATAPAAGFETAVDAAAREVLDHSGVPGLSVAVVRDGHIVLERAWGRARLDPPVPAAAGMRFAIGSVSKEFLAASLLLLQEDGRVSLDDPVAKYFPGLTRAADIRIRDLLSHTSGYRDYWPQDYVPGFMQHPISAEQLLADWAGRPLDFEPGAQWQYSNTGYVLAATIAQRVAGEPLFDYMHRRIFAPLGMASPYDVDRAPLPAEDAGGYLRYAMGPLRPAPKEGAGWLFGAGGLAMTAADLARWDMGLMHGTLLRPASFAQMASAVRLANGTSAQYGYGLFVRMVSGRRMLEHDGEVSGFTAENELFPDQDAAIIVLANEDAVSAAADLADRIRDLLFVDDSPASHRQLERARGLFQQLQHGKVDRALLTPNASAYFDGQALADARIGLHHLGAVREFREAREQLRGGLRLREYDVKCRRGSVVIVAREQPEDGLFEQFQVTPAPGG
jgi:CubicO group peptidase (beta-lactamase class C family)